MREQQTQSLLQIPYFDGFVPRIIHVFYRDESFWRDRRYTVPVASTSMHNFSYVVQGRGTFELNGVAYELSQGSIFHFPRGASIRLSSSRVHPLCYYTVQYSQAFLEWEGMEPKLSKAQTSALPFEQAVVIEHSNLRWQMRDLFELWQHQDPGFTWKARITFLAVLQACEETLLGRQRGEERGTRLIEESVRFIKSHLRDTIDRECLARQAAVSVSYYSLLFKRHTGYTPNRYITVMRIEHAKRRLRISQDLIADIARESGFQDPLYFTKLFTREVGMTPSEYRNA